VLITILLTIAQNAPLQALNSRFEMPFNYGTHYLEHVSRATHIRPKRT